jgi:hypothetical protein
LHIANEEANAIPLDATQSEEPVQECSNQQDTSSDDDEMIIITLDHNDQNAAAFAWLDQNEPKMERLGEDCFTVKIYKFLL